MKKIFIFQGILFICWLPVLFGLDAIRKASELLPLAISHNPYFLPGQAGLLYVVAPAVVLSAAILFISPGLLLATALPAASHLGTWILYGFGISLLVVCLPVQIIQSIVGQPITGYAMLLIVIGDTFACLVYLYIRVRRGLDVQFPSLDFTNKATLITMVLAPWLLIAFLAPKIYWESLNGDGAHAIEVLRLLQHQPFPFWNQSAGEIAAFPGITSSLFSYPGSFFVRIFGEFEASARISFFLYLPVLFAAILAFVEHNARVSLRIVERLLVWLALLIYSLTIAYSATYSPYSADLALPATQDTLFLICFLGFALAFLRDETTWWGFFLVLSLLALPSGLVMAAFWLLAVVIVIRPRPWKRIVRVITVLIAFQIGAMLFSKLLPLLGHPAPGNEYQLLGMLGRFAFLQLEDFRRILFILIPSGILPAISLLLWRWQDDIGRLFAVVSWVYFLFFYFQAYTVLHYYIPVMIFPLISFWRIDNFRTGAFRQMGLAMVFITGAIALFLSLPENLTIETTTRFVGNSIEIRTGDYQTTDPQVYRSSMILVYLFPYDWDPAVPGKSLGGSPLVWNYYSHHQPALEIPTNYRLQPASELPPPGMHLLVSKDNFSLYLANDSVLESQRALKPNSPAGSKIYQIPRNLIFRTIQSDNGPRIISMIEILDQLGINTDVLIKRFGRY